MKLKELHKRKEALQMELIDVQSAIAELTQQHPKLYTCHKCGVRYTHSESFKHFLNDCVTEVIG